MKGVSGHDYALQGYTGQGTTWANGMNFVMNHAPGAGTITRPIDQQSSMLPLYQGCPHTKIHHYSLSMTNELVLICIIFEFWWKCCCWCDHVETWIEVAWWHSGQKHWSPNSGSKVQIAPSVFNRFKIEIFAPSLGVKL